MDNLKDGVEAWLVNYNPDYSLLPITSNDSAVYKFICDAVKEKLDLMEIQYES